jgi:hypothetical protein
MGCLFALFSLITPRVVIALIFLFTHWFSVAYQTVFWPILGFLFMPYTTLAYLVAMIYSNHNITNGWIVLIVIAVILDLGGQGMSLNHR